MINILYPQNPFPNTPKSRTPIKLLQTLNKFTNDCVKYLMLSTQNLQEIMLPAIRKQSFTDANLPLKVNVQQNYTISFDRLFLNITKLAAQNRIKFYETLYHMMQLCIKLDDDWYSYVDFC